MSIVEVRIPNFAESITEVTLASWLVSEGDVVEMDQAICEIETDKASQELYAEAAGAVTLVAEEGEDLSIGALICKINTSAASVKPPKGKNAPPTSVVKETIETEDYKTAITPVAEKILSEKGIDPSTVSGTGANGKITKEDAVKAGSGATDTKEQPAVKEGSNTGSILIVGRAESREKMSRLRRTISKRLVSVKNETAMLTTFNEIDMKPVMDLRSKYKESFKEKHGVGLGFMSFFTKACCLALMEFPQVNARLEETEIVYRNYCDISIAVSAPQGLVVPVVRDAHSMNMAEIEKEIKRLAIAARDNKLSMDEMTGGTFSITNGGVFGSMLSTPILNPPQSAILGMHNIVERPVAVNGAVEIRPVMYLALSYDHRIIDGKESVSFLYRVKEYLEDPSRMLIGI